MYLSSGLQIKHRPTVYFMFIVFILQSFSHYYLCLSRPKFFKLPYCRAMITLSRVYAHVRKKLPYLIIGKCYILLSCYNIVGPIVIFVQTLE